MFSLGHLPGRKGNRKTAYFHYFHGSLLYNNLGLFSTMMEMEEVEK